MITNSVLSDAINKHGVSRESLLPVLQYVISKEQWLKEETMEKVAQAFGMSAAEVYGVATFYSFLDTEPRGRYVIRVCRTISCDMAGKKEIIESLKNELRVKTGETTADGMFTLLETNCMGWCHKGPAMLVNDDVFTELTPDKAVAVIHEYRKKSKQ
ncbi:MAG TPA: NADH-quinone oxidoreductase subunit NuoE [Spirochaetota bacterium]|nr:NADH-quinone oxidoreductase subunit NuoE [Spirochaetota bacterium]HPJ36654.1 NADH-quinone oxidoreductase subunit NuoE [Spirochaetota bacterium]